MLLRYEDLVRCLARYPIDRYLVRPIFGVTDILCDRYLARRFDPTRVFRREAKRSPEDFVAGTSVGMGLVGLRARGLLNGSRTESSEVADVEHTWILT